jgi:ankyrin repeat protein
MRTVAEVLAEVDRADLFYGVKVDSVSSARAAGETALYICAKWNDGEAIRILANGGADIDKRGEDGNTPLHYAAMLGNLSAVEALVDLRAANTRDRYGNRPIDLAADHAAVQALLKARGYDA